MKAILNHLVSDNKVTNNLKTFRFDNSIVTVKRVCISPCASDEYIVTISQDNGEEKVVSTFGGIFESDEVIAKRVYDSI